MTRSFGRTTLSGIVLLLSLGCNAGETNPHPLGVAHVSMALTEADITRIRVEISGPGIEPPITADLTLQGPKASGLIAHIPAGEDRQFKVMAYRHADVVCTAQSNMAITADETKQIFFVLQCQSDAKARGGVELYGILNTPPHIEAASASSAMIPVGKTLELAATATDPDADEKLTYRWSAAEGTFSTAEAAKTSWRAPETAGDYPLTVTVTDSHGAENSLNLLIHVMGTNSEESWANGYLEALALSNEVLGDRPLPPSAAVPPAPAAASSPPAPVTTTPTSVPPLPAAEPPLTASEPPPPTPSDALEELEGLIPLADTHLRNGSYSRNHFGNSAELELKENEQPGHLRKILIKFDLKDMAAAETLKTVTLALFGNNAKGKTTAISVFGVDDDNWEEKKVSWENQPTVAPTLLGTMTITDKSDYYKLDVTSFIQTQLQKDKQVTFLISATGSMKQLIRFHSKESADHPPRLVLEG
jgi:hypothetical protein